MISAPSLSGAALLIGLSLFLGFAYEDFFAHSNIRRPGGIRTFPILASAGGVLYLFDPTHFLPFTAGLIVLGIWLAVFYRQHIGERDDEAEPNVGLVVPALNVHAYLLGPIALALPPWFAVGFTVIAVLLLTGREKLHAKTSGAAAIVNASLPSLIGFSGNLAAAYSDASPWRRRKAKGGEAGPDSIRNPT
jgi:hypothetical protein